MNQAVDVISKHTPEAITSSGVVTMIGSASVWGLTHAEWAILGIQIGIFVGVLGLIIQVIARWAVIKKNLFGG
ncbi:MAG: hypothetical protein JKY96_04475 [Phycisphaerales bacterium]|nr:hypothetical protein [Phycisphaerales bacterium]